MHQSPYELHKSIGCTTLDARHASIYLFEQHNISYFDYYRSSSQNVLCFTLSLSEITIRVLIDSEVTFDILLPIPPMLKLDLSVVHGLSVDNTDSVIRRDSYNYPIFDSLNDESDLELVVILHLDGEEHSLALKSDEEATTGLGETSSVSSFSNIESKAKSVLKPLKNKLVKRWKAEYYGSRDEQRDTRGKCLFYFGQEECNNARSKGTIIPNGNMSNPASLDSTHPERRQEHIDEVLMSRDRMSTLWSLWSKEWDKVSYMSGTDFKTAAKDDDSFDCGHNSITFKSIKFVSNEVYGSKGRKRDKGLDVDVRGSKVVEMKYSIPHEMIKSNFGVKSSSRDGFSSTTCLSKLVRAYSLSPEVYKVVLTSPKRLLNNFARGVVQTGLKSRESYGALNLLGENVVVGLADTGIDLGSCYFYDTNGSTPRSTADRPILSMQRRKVVQYVNYSNSNGDTTSGHGTHVAGTIAAKCYNSSLPNAEFNGIAENAKIAFFDIGMLDGSLVVPNAISDIFKLSDSVHSSVGARIHSNSWGGGYWYDTMATDIDQYLYDFQQHLVLFAAGNSGQHGRHSIVSPGISKNVLTVGASDTGHESQNIDNVAYFSSVGPGTDGR